MPNSLHSSTASGTFRLEWPPSRLLAAAFVLLGVLAAFSTLASEMPRVPAAALAVVAVGWGVMLARRERRQPVRVLSVDGQGDASLDGVPLASLEIRWRGPLGFARWRDARGRSGVLVGAPDALDPALRRELRLVERARQPARPVRSVAP